MSFMSMRHPEDWQAHEAAMADTRRFLGLVAAKAAPRRFTGEPQTGFGSLGPDDSLVARIERIWPIAKPQVIEIGYGHQHTEDDTVYGWNRKRMTRDEAATALRLARKRGMLIEAHRTGYSITGD